MLAPPMCSQLAATRHKSYLSATKSGKNPCFIFSQSYDYPLVIKDITFLHLATVVQPWFPHCSLDKAEPTRDLMLQRACNGGCGCVRSH